MKLSLAIERNRRPLLRIVATLFAMIGLDEGGVVERLSSPVYRSVLRVLRPAESAARRLIVVAARSITVKPVAPRPAVGIAPRVNRKGRRRAPAFRLFDSRQRFTSAFADERPRRRIWVRVMRRPEPRVHVIGFDPRVPLFRRASPVKAEPEPQSVPHGMVNARRICRRLIAIKSALEDLPRQARRYARWQSKPQAGHRPQLASALRPGAPPGHRKNPSHKVDEVLAECDWLARQPRQPDTS